MANRALISYIQEGLKRGYSQQSLRAYLLQQGYDPNEVDAALANAGGGGGKKFLVFMIILLLIAGGAIAAVLVFKDDLSGSTRVTSPQQLNQGSEAQETTTPSRTAVTPTSTPKPRSTTPVDTPSAEPEPEQTTPSRSTTRTPSRDAPSSSQTQRFTQTEEVDESFSSVRSINDCDQFELDVRDRCVVEFSWNKDHVGFCDRITAEEYRDQCFSQYALRHEDKQQCESVENKYTREICVFFLLTAEKLSELNVEYTIDPRTPEIIYDQERALQNLQRKVAQEEAALERQIAQKRATAPVEQPSTPPPQAPETNATVPTNETLPQNTTSNTTNATA